MNKTHHIHILITAIALALLMFACSQKPDTWEMAPPDTVAAFAPDSIGMLFEPHSALEFEPGTDHILWSVFWREATNFHQKIVESTYEDGYWSIPEVVNFSSLYSCGGPQFSADGNTLYFTSIRPIPGAPDQHNRVWVIHRNGDDWSEPEVLNAPFNEQDVSSQVSVASNGNLYFSRRVSEPLNNDLFVAEYVDGQYQPERSLNGGVNTDYLEADPWVDPQERFILFSVYGASEGSQGGMDLYVCVRNEDGSWGERVNLGPSVNTSDDERFPSMSDDGRALFFTRMQSAPDGRWMNSTFWVNADSVVALPK